MPHASGPFVDALDALHQHRGELLAILGAADLVGQQVAACQSASTELSHRQPSRGVEADRTTVVGSGVTKESLSPFQIAIS